ncbi:MAG: hypothetical protein QW057_06255 [Candidatus Bathyarchaeia archaeon]
MPAPLCELCGVLPALYVCQVCGKSVCDRDFLPAERACVRCSQTVGKPVGPAERGFELGSLLTLAGFGLAFIGMLIIFLALIVGAEGISGGIVVFIGPFPVALGFGAEAIPLLALAFIIVAVIILGLLLWAKLPRAYRPPVQPQPSR